MYSCVCMYVCMYVCMHACMHACTYVCLYVCMYVCMWQTTIGTCLLACILTYIWLQSEISDCARNSKHPTSPVCTPGGAWDLSPRGRNAEFSRWYAHFHSSPAPTIQPRFEVDQVFGKYVYVYIYIYTDMCTYAYVSIYIYISTH